MGQIEPVDEGLIGLARTLADAMDDEATNPQPNRYTLGHLAGRLLPVLLELRGSRRDSGSDVGWDEELEVLKAELRGATEVRNAEGPLAPDDRA